MAMLCQMSTLLLFAVAMGHNDCHHEACVPGALVSIQDSNETEETQLLQKKVLAKNQVLGDNEALKTEPAPNNLLPTANGGWIPEQLWTIPFNRYIESGAEVDIDDSLVAPCNSCGAPGSVGPMFVVMLCYGDQVPEKSIAEFEEILFGVPGYADILKESSWGQTTLAPEDVDIWKMESATDPSNWGSSPSLGTVVFEVTKQTAYTQKKEELEAARGRSFELILIIQPGDVFQATAFVPGEYSRYRDGSITWQTVAHEIGHNWGLLHAGGFYSDNNGGQIFEQYADDALMGYQRAWRLGDFTAVARYNLGWIAAGQIAPFPIVQQASIRALNEGPQSDSARLLMVLPCATCVSTAYSCTGGNLFASFRVKDPGNRYGVELDGELREYKTGRPLILVDRVHVHFQCTGGRATELWTTIEEHSTYSVPDAALWIHVCKTRTNTGATEIAVVHASSQDEADASSQCPQDSCKLSDCEAGYALNPSSNNLCPGSECTSADCAGVCVQATYVVASIASAVCGENEELTRSEDCQVAAEQLGLTYQTSGAWSAYPSGCFKLGSYAYFNTALNGIADSSSSPICQEPVAVVTPAPTPEPTPPPAPTPAPTPSPTPISDPEPLEVTGTRSGGKIFVFTSVKGDAFFGRNWDGQKYPVQVNGVKGRVQVWNGSSEINVPYGEWDWREDGLCPYKGEWATGMSIVHYDPPEIDSSTLVATSGHPGGIGKPGAYFGFDIQNGNSFFGTSASEWSGKTYRLKVNGFTGKIRIFKKRGKKICSPYGFWKVDPPLFEWEAGMTITYDDHA